MVSCPRSALFGKLEAGERRSKKKAALPRMLRKDFLAESGELARLKRERKALFKSEAHFRLRFARFSARYFQAALEQNRSRPLNLSAVKESLEAASSERPDTRSVLALLELFSYKVPFPVALRLLGLVGHFSRRRVERSFVSEVLFDLWSKPSVQKVKYWEFFCEWARTCRGRLARFEQEFPFPSPEDAANLLEFFQHSKRSRVETLVLEPSLDSQPVQVFCRRRKQGSPFRWADAESRSCATESKSTRSASCDSSASSTACFSTEPSTAWL